MKEFPFPVALVFFRRLDCLEPVLEAVLAAKPRKIYAYGDGSRPGKPGEAEACAAAAELVRRRLSGVSDLRIEVSQANLGLRGRVETALDDVFSRENAAVILEDDCVPEASFFPFAAELLERYADDPRVGSVTGTSFSQPGELPGDADYYFSKYPHCWGWATWKRAWSHYDRTGGFWPCNLHALSLSFAGKLERDYWMEIFEKTQQGGLDSWAYRWTLSCWQHGMLTATPRINLVRNIGTGEGATHTRDNAGMEILRNTGRLHFPLRHPAPVEQDQKADRRTFWRHHVMGARLPLWARLLRSLHKRYIPIYRA